MLRCSKTDPPPQSFPAIEATIAVLFVSLALTLTTFQEPPLRGIASRAARQDRPADRFSLLVTLGGGQAGRNFTTVFT
jgi:hypothetical protein